MQAGRTEWRRTSRASGERGRFILTGQKTAYLQAQLEAFATGARRNDTNQQMRQIARGLTEAEIKALALWYGSGAVATSMPAKSPQ